MSVVAAGLSAPIVAGLSASIAVGLSGDAAGGVVCAITGAARNIAMALLSRRFLVIWLSSSSLSGIQQQGPQRVPPKRRPRSEEHKAELQSLMRISYADFG